MESKKLLGIFIGIITVLVIIVSIISFLIFMMIAIFSKGLMLHLTKTENGIGTMAIMGTFAALSLIITIINFRFMKKED